MRQNNGVKIVWDEQLWKSVDDKLNPKRRMPCRMKESETCVYFNAREKIYPGGNVEIKRYKFISAYQKDGVEKVKSDVEIEVEERLEKMSAEKIKKEPVEKSQDEVDKKILENIQITRNKIYDIASSNDWTHFITLTYNNKACDRYSFSDTSKKVRIFFNNFMRLNKSTCPNFRYLIIPECHKDGAYHYHGLIYLEDDTSMVDSGRRTKKEQPIYNFGKWLNGYSTATKIDDLNACVHYITKYVTKSIGDDYCKGQRRFYYSRNCAKPVVNRLMLTDEELWAYDKSYESEVSIGYDTDVDTLIRERYGVDVNEILEEA